MASKPGQKSNASRKNSSASRNRTSGKKNTSGKKWYHDERWGKITGVIFILIGLFLFVSFISYLFTWRIDQDVAKKGFSVLFDNRLSASNVLGRLGALISHYFFSYGFGVASFLVCTFFFVVGINLIFRQNVFSIRRNLKYVTLGMMVLCVAMSFLFGNHEFPFGGAVGDLIHDKLVGALGKLGTAAILVFLAVIYFIWQFNPSWSWPEKQVEPEKIPATTPEAVSTATNEETINEKNIEEKTLSPLEKEGIHIEFPEQKPEWKFELVEKDLPEEKNSVSGNTSTVELQPEITSGNVSVKQSIPKKKTEDKVSGTVSSLPLEIQPPEKQEEESVSENLPPYEPTLDLRFYKYPTLDLLETHGSEKIIHDANELENNKNQIISTLRNYDIEIQKISATVGPTVTLYEIVPAPGIRISKIKNLEDDIALSLAALGIRIIAPIPGKGTIGIEVPNVRKSVVSMKTLLSSEKFQHNNYSLPIAIGKKIDNDNFIVDLTSMPHLLMAGATGQGKSVGLNAILVSLLYRKHPSQLKLVLIDPKKVELSIYRKIEKHFLAKLPGEEDPIITDTKKVVYTLNALCIEMDNRYDLLKEAGARNIKEYNEKFIKRKLNPQKGHQYLPFIVLVIDEFADLIMTAGKEIELPIARLAQLARAVGIHLIIATQRPSVNIITGTIKANFPSRIAFKVSSKIDSRTIIDTGGAEQLIGKGDMLISHNGEITRLQCAFVDTPEVERIVDFIGNQPGYPEAFRLPEYVDEKEMEEKSFDLAERDSLFEEAARLIVQTQIGSTSLLQRRMKLGYNRAGRLMDQLEAAGIVGPSQGSKVRDVLIKSEMELQQHLNNLG
ncbi:MAG: DNA translocase FtsK [Chitinophagaceae bacterium]|nr:DNA translocase FtsK [Chitinophagaceae bacterium]